MLCVHVIISWDDKTVEIGEYQNEVFETRSVALGAVGANIVHALLISCPTSAVAYMLLSAHTQAGEAKLAAGMAGVQVTGTHSSIESARALINKNLLSTGPPR